MSFAQIFVLYICPTLGCLMSAAMFAAPINDLRHALMAGSMGPLNPFPWIIMTGNTTGWLLYGYYVRDPFVIAANLPGFLLSFWLNMGAAKLQYQDIRKTAAGEVNTHAEPLLLGASNVANNEDLVMVPQEKGLLMILGTWSIVLIWSSWFYPEDMDPAIPVGILVNINLIFFYGAPLQTLRSIIEERTCESIHFETMVMNWFNSTFWTLYGIARVDFVIIVPNAIGLALGLLQGFLCLLYPRGGASLAAYESAEPLIPETALQ